MVAVGEGQSSSGTGDRLVVELEDGPKDVILRSAALLHGKERTSIRRGGIGIGPGPGELTPDPAGDGNNLAEVVPGGNGHVIGALTESGSVYVNGERLIRGQSRWLNPGDAIAVGSHLYYYMPAGQSPVKLPSVKPVDAGTVTTANDVTLIGRDAGCDVVLDYPTVSRRHAVIRTTPNGSTIEDLSSASGVRVNGDIIRRSALEVGDEIAIGPYRIIYDGEEFVERATADGLPVRALDVSVRVGDLTILQPTDLHLRGGEMVAFIGESGAGKTTLLKTLAGVSIPTGGSVLCGGEPVRSRLGEIGYVPQFDIVHGQLTVYEALDYAAKLRLPPDTTDAERHSRVTEVIGQLGIEERTDVRVNLLSGGQRKRVAVGVELLHEPGALFLDEPTTGLDPGLERLLMDLFSELADSGRTVCLVTHATGSLSLCDRVVVMGRGGILRFDGSPAELLEEFGVDRFDDVYAELAREDPQQPVAVEQQLHPVHSNPVRPRPQIRQSFTYQARVLAGRYLTLMSRDRRNMIGLAIQTLVLALLTAIIFKGDVFQFPPARVDSLTGKAGQLVFLMVTICIWMGSIASAREIVKERSVVARELDIGVGLNAYIWSKLLILLGFVTVQVFTYFMIVLIIKPMGSGGFNLLLILIGSSWLAVLLGLVVSAWANSEDQATGLIPILLVPQLLFGGAVVTLNDMPGFVQALANLVPSRWGYDAAGTAIDMQTRMGFPGQANKVLQESYGTQFFNLELMQFIFVGLVFFGLFYMALAFMIDRHETE